MRELKFRAWDGTKMYLPEYADKEDFHILADGTIVETHEYGYERHELTSARGDNWSLMQFTGLKDKNGVEIYEGDVVEWSIQSRAVITFENGCFYLSDTGLVLGYQLRNKGVRVIGNIYEPRSRNENKELLEGQ